MRVTEGVKMIRTFPWHDENYTKLNPVKQNTHQKEHTNHNTVQHATSSAVFF